MKRRLKRSEGIMVGLALVGLIPPEAPAGSGKHAGALSRFLTQVFHTWRHAWHTSFLAGTC